MVTDTLHILQPCAKNDKRAVHLVPLRNEASQKETTRDLLNRIFCGEYLEDGTKAEIQSRALYRKNKVNPKSVPNLIEVRNLAEVDLGR